MRRFAPGLLLGLAACVAPRPAPTPTVAPPAPPPTIVPPAPAVTDWRDLPKTPGDWSYARDAAGSTASFGQPGAAADFILRCERGSRTILLSRPGETAGPMTIRTSYEEKSWPASPIAGGRIAVTLAAADPFLDRIAFSRGRFSVADPGAATLILPAWAEPARVIEDCRG